MNTVEYLVSHGASGDFGRFRPATSATYERGDHVIVRSHHGLELGVVLCAATSEHGRFLSRTALGEILRRTTEEDECEAEKRRQRAGQIFADARRLSAEFNLPLEVLDVEVVWDGQQAIVHHLRPLDCDYRDLVSALSRRHGITILMENLALPVEPAEAGCGRPGCGKGGGGCDSCGSGSGCSSGTCGKAIPKEQVAAYLTGLEQPALERMRTPLL
jgi:hypothetical protein